MVNGPVGPRKVDLAHLVTIGRILTAARDISSLRTKEIVQLSLKGTTDEIRNTATGLQDLIIQGVKVGELDFTAVASRGAELLQASEAELTKATAAREEAERELHTASGRITQIEEARATAVAKLGETEAQLAKVTGERVDVSKEWSAAQAKVQQKLEEIAGLEKRITEIDEARQAAIRHQDELKRQTDEAVGKQRELQGQVDDLKLRIGDAERIRGERIAKERELLRLRGQVGELERIASQAREELEQLRNDPEIAGIRSRITEMERLLGEKEAELAQARAQFTQLEGTLTEKEFDHTQKSGEMGETVRIRTAEKEAALAELATTRTELERFRQWADFGVRTYNETLPGLKQKMQEYEAVLARLRQELVRSQDETANLRSTPRKLPPALTILAELKEKDPKAFQFIVKVLITLASRISEEDQKSVSAPISTIGVYIQKTQPSPERVQAMEIDEFQNRAVVILDMVARAVRLREKDASTADLLNKLHRFFTKPETAPEAKEQLAKLLEKILDDPDLIQDFMAQIIRQELLAEINYLADPANEDEFMGRSQKMYLNNREELEALLNDPSIDDPTRVTINRILTDASKKTEQTISFQEEPTNPEGKPGKPGLLRRWFGKKS